jgi:hypothetical protein
MGKKPWLLAIALCAPLPAWAQGASCAADVKVTAMGLQKPIDDTRRPMRDLALARYRIDATSSEKQCAVVTFKLKYSYQDAKGNTVSEDADAQSLRVRGGKVSQQGEWPLRRELPRVTWTAEDISCKPCQ